MALTKEEALKIFCPGISDNCVGDKCMAWEWVGFIEKTGKRAVFSHATRQYLTEDIVEKLPELGICLKYRKVED